MALDFPSGPSNGDTYAGYIYESARGVWLKQAPGIYQNEAPLNPTAGQFWYDADDELLYVYSGSSWVEAGGGAGGASLEVGATAPESPTAGALWWNSDTGSLYLYYDDGDTQQWVAANGPQVFVGTSAPAGYQGQLWFDSNEGKTYIYYDDGTSGQWVSAIGGSLSGNVIQVVSTTKTDAYSASTSGNTWTSNVTGLEASITPKSTTSKILVTVSVNGGRSTSLDIIMLGITRDSSLISIGDSAGSRSSVTAASYGSSSGSFGWGSVTATYLDSPSTTDSVTYGVQLRNTNSVTETIYVNRNATDTDSVAYVRATSTITLMEIAG